MKHLIKEIRSPAAPQMNDLCEQLTELSGGLQTHSDWPSEQLDRCAEAGVFRWFMSEEWGGYGWSDEDVVRGYLRLSSACLTTTFVITQFVAACRRISASSDKRLKSELLPELAAGKIFATVGISHLTTSRRHLAKPVLVAEPVTGGWSLNGVAPWVTGGRCADELVVGSSLKEGTQVLMVAAMNSRGIQVENGFELVGLSGSQTGKVGFENVFVPDSRVLAGPGENIMSSGGGSTGGLQTSALAVGLSCAAIEYLKVQAVHRAELQENLAALVQQMEQLQEHLFSAAIGQPSCSREALRTEANSLVLRSTQSALVAAKGAGYVEGHRVGRWCREALFFLVWSCPQPVAQANLCELAGLEL